MTKGSLSLTSSLSGYVFSISGLDLNQFGASLVLRSFIGTQFIGLLEPVKTMYMFTDDDDPHYPTM